MRNFAITRDGQALSASAASSTVAIAGPAELVTTALDVMIWNPGPLPVYVRAGGADVVATTLSMIVPPQSLQPFAKGSATHIAVITGGGTQACTLWLGEGW